MKQFTEEQSKKALKILTSIASRGTKLEYWEHQIILKLDIAKAQKFLMEYHKTLEKK